MVAIQSKPTITSEDLFTQKIYWLNQLSNELPETNLITDYVRPAIYTGKHKSVSFQFSAYLSKDILSLSNNSYLSTYLILLSAFSVLMQKYTGNTDNIIGSPVYRSTEIDSNLNQVLPLRINVDKNQTFKDLLLQVKATTINAYCHQNYPIDELTQLLNLPNQQNRYPFCDIVLLLENIHQQNDITNISNDVTLSFQIIDNLLLGRVDYNEHLFREDAIKCLIKSYLNVLECVLRNPHTKITDISFLSIEEQHQLLEEFNHKIKEYPITQTIDQLFVQQAQATPNRIAVEDANSQLTYQQLNAKANQLAKLLQNIGIKKGEIVGILKERDINFLIGILAIYKAGGAYLPIDSQYPPDRIKYMVSNSEVKIVLTDSSCLDIFIDLVRNNLRLKSLVCLDNAENTINSAALTDINIYNQLHFQHLSTENFITSNTGADAAYMLYTSGSTGLPKGAIVRHDGAINHIYAQFDELELTADFAFLQSAPSSTDISVWQFLAPLLIGGKTVIVDTESGFIPEKLFKVLQEKSITVVELVPAVFGGLIDYICQLPEDQKQLPDLKWMMVVGEPVSVKRVNQWLSLYPSIRIADAYGPTEAADDITQFIIDQPLPENQRTVSIGQPLTNLNIYILDRKMRLVPIGFPGEICVSGIGVGDGYWQNPEKTKLSFVPNPFPNYTKKLPAGNPDLMYKTGDLGRWLPDGNIEFLGRIDNQVKIRGFRVELEEIEAMLRQHSSVRETVVIVREDNCDKRLVAYVVPHTESSADLVSELRQILKQRLPQHMMPSAFMLLDDLPLAPSGKVDRCALPAPDFTQLQSEKTFVAASTPIQEILMGIWAEVLSLEKVGIHDNFFELGGHSLLATRVISKVRQAFELELPLRRLFEQPTIAGLATVIDKIIKAGIGLDAPLIECVSRDGELILSFAQQRLWFLTQLQPNSPFNNLCAAFRLQGELNIQALQQSFSEIVCRHEVLRTNFQTVAGKPVQIIASESNFSLPVVDLSNLAADLQAVQIEQLTQTEAQQPFNLQTDLMLRAKLLRLGEQEYLLLLTVHHIASDGWSIGVFVEELSTLYQAFCTGQIPNLQALPIQYADFAAWQRSWLVGDVLESQLAYWRQHLEGAPALLELPTDYTRPAVQTFRGAYCTFEISVEQTAAIKSFSQEQGCTLFMTLLAAFKTLLYRYTGNEDIVVGSPIANRNRAEIEGLIGFFVNTLVLRSHLAGNLTFEELLGRVREVALGAYSHQDLPFDLLVEELQPQRSLSYAPLFQVMFVLQNAPMSEIELSGLSLSLLENDNGTAKFDLTLFMEETTAGIVGTFEYSTDLFEADTIQRMSQHLQILLAGIVSDPQQQLWELPLLSEAEKTLLAKWNDTQAAYPQECIHELFVAQVERTPDAVAVVCGAEKLTYKELNQRANQLAHYLQKLGVGKEVLVGICVERSLDMIVGLLGILKAGGAYLPLDPAYPQQRLAFMLADAGVSFVICHSSFVDRFDKMTVVCVDTEWDQIAQASQENPVSGATAENLAYVIYTSGSTGKPKGVLGLHKGAVNRFSWMWQTYSFTEGEVCCQKTSLNFVDSVWDIFGPLLQGVKTVIIGDRIVKDPHQFVETLAQHHVTRLVLVPSLLRVLLDNCSNLQERLPKLKFWVTSGEALTIDLLHKFRQTLPDSILLNLYGSSEVSADVTYYSITPTEPLPERVAIGRAIANAQIHLLDQYLQPVPIGVAGEIYVSGAGLARGYINQPELTQEKFILKAGDRFNLFQEDKLYKTGDLARYQADGNLEFLGRIDQQVKLRGFRVEMGEVAAILSQHPQVRDAVVAVKKDELNQQLLAYFVANSQQVITISELQQFLKQKLPEFMLPSAFVMLEALPLLPNGKVDYQSLLIPEGVRPELEQKLQLPQTETEQVIAHIWQEVLQIDEVGIHDNFFELGGNSLLLIQVYRKLQQRFQSNFTLVEMFQYPTISQLTQFFNQESRTELSQLESRTVSIQRRKEIRQKSHAEARRRRQEK